MEFEPLKDTTKSGKERPWNSKKRMSLETASIYDETASVYGKESLENKAKRMGDCGDILTFKQTPEGLRLNQAFFCKVRLCPMCNWRRSLKLTYENRRIVEVANSRQKLRWIFLTLTVRNCKGDKLDETIKSMSHAYRERFMKYGRVKDSIEGWFRALEITKNNEDNTYHPHYHVLIAVKPSYFRSKNKYINQEEWTDLWKEAMKLSYTPVVHVQAVKARKTKKDFKEIVIDIENSISEAQSVSKAILEVSKYTVKDTDILNGTEEQKIETVYTLDNAMAHKRLVAWGGCLKKIREELRLEQKEDDLIHIDDNNVDEVSEEIQKVTAYWNYGLSEYVLKDIKKLPMPENNGSHEK
ncbi:protein rep [Priestia aryabhattai]|uniref:protein rep n=1 Tax=Priestia aryabhattai TaxID=412384 RepID=UPI001CFE32E8|nr:protein rep [Priestia aryabhattai]